MKTKAVALKYSGSENSAPVVVAKGDNFLAQQLIQLAQEYNIPMVEDEELLEFLLMLDVEQEIPEHLYEAVAAVFKEIYNLDKEYIQ